MFKGLRENAKIVIISAVTSLLFSTGGFALASAFITGADIKDETITNKDIANYTIGYKKLRSSSVNTYKIANYSIKGIDIKDRSIPPIKLTSNFAPANHTHGSTSHTHSYASISHNHDSRYYTVSEVNGQIDALEIYSDDMDDILYDYVVAIDDLIIDYIDGLHGILSLNERQTLRAKVEALRESMPVRQARP